MQTGQRHSFSDNLVRTAPCLRSLSHLSCRPNQVAEKVAARISENFSDAAIVMVTMTNLASV